MNLKYGMSDQTLGGYNIQELQGKLQTIAQLFGRPDFDPGLIDGVFGMKTRNAVIAFQSSMSLTPDGVAGDTTQSAIEAVLQSDPGTVAFAPKQKTVLKKTISPGDLVPKTITGTPWAPPDPKTVLDWQLIGTGIVVMAAIYFIFKEK